MNNKVKSVGLFVGLSAWVSIISVGIYEFKHHTSVEEQMLVYECSSELITKKGINMRDYPLFYVEKLGFSSAVTFEATRKEPYVAGESFTCILDQRGIVKEILN
jgi:hypothetical protein